MYHNRKGLTDPLNSMLANITAISSYKHRSSFNLLILEMIISILAFVSVGRCMVMWSNSLCHVGGCIPF